MKSGVACLDSNHVVPTCACSITGWLFAASCCACMVTVVSGKFFSLVGSDGDKICNTAKTSGIGVDSRKSMQSEDLLSHSTAVELKEKKILKRNVRKSLHCC